MNDKTNRILLSAAIAGIVGAGAISGTALAKAKGAKAGGDVKCFNANACSGKGGCKTAKNACGGKNGCKGQGFVMMNQKACDAVGGSTTEPAAAPAGEPKKEG